MNLSQVTNHKVLSFFVGMYLFSLLVSMAGIEIFSGLIFATLLAILIQSRLKADGELQPSFPRLIGVDWAILFFILAAFISFVIQPDFNPDRIREFTPLRWVFLLYGLTYAFHYIGVKQNDTWMERFFLLTMAIGLYAFFQANTGVDIIRGDNRAVQFDHYDKFPFYRASGFFSNPMTYGHQSAMWGALALAFLLVYRREKKWLLLSGLSLFCILTGLYSSHTRGSWIAVFFGLLAVAFIRKKRWGLTFVVVTLVLGGLMGVLVPPFAERVATIFDFKFTSNLSRLYIWKAHFAIFKDYPWFGCGMNYNPYLLSEYYEKLEVPTTFRQIGHAHNTYLQWLAGTGVVGFAAYMVFILQALWLSLKEYMITQPSDKFLRALLLGSIGGQVAFHFGGLTECNFRDAEVKSFFLTLIAFVLAIRLQRKFSKRLP